MQRYLTALLAVFIALNVLFSTGVYSHLSDQDVATGNTITAYVPELWMQTTYDDFNGGTKSGIDVLLTGSIGLHGSGGSVDVPSIFALIGGGSDHFYQYSIGGETWTRAPDAPFLAGPGSKLVSDGAYYIFAFQGGGSDAFWRFDARTGVWDARTNAPGPVDAGSDLYCSGGAIYALQGGGSTAIWSYNVLTNVWTTLSITGTQYAMGPGSNIVAGDTNLYVLRAGTPNLISVPRAGGTWNLLTDLPAALKVGLGADMDVKMSNNGKPTAYVIFGGNTNNFQSNELEKNHKWSSLTSTPGAIGAGAGTIYRGSQESAFLYVLAGGSTGNFYRLPFTWGNPSASWGTLANAPEVVSDGGGLAFANSWPHQYSNGHFMSSVHDTGKVGEIHESMLWDVSIPSNGQNVTMQVRASDDATLAGALWTTLPNNRIVVSGGGGAYTHYADLSGITGRYVQYRAELTTMDQTFTPVLHEVRLYYRAV